MDNIRNGRPESVARTEILKMDTCSFCGKSVRQKRNSAHKPRIVFRMEADGIAAIRYLRPRYYCAGCKREMLPEMDGMMPKAKFDREILVMLALLHYDRGLSYREISAFILSSFGISVAPATIYNSVMMVDRSVRSAGMRASARDNFKRG